jgi:O-antigen ligase
MESLGAVFIRDSLSPLRRPRPCVGSCGGISDNAVKILVGAAQTRRRRATPPPGSMRPSPDPTEYLICRTMDNMLTKTMAPLRVWTGALVFAVPSLILTTGFGIGLASFLFILTLPFVWTDARAALARHWLDLRWVVLAFLFNFAVVLLYFLVRPEEPLHSLEKPLRMFCAVSALMVVLAARPSRRMLWWGAVAGGVGAMLLVGYQRIVLGIERPGGLTNAITFGDISLCLGLVALTATLDVANEVRPGSRRRVLWLSLGALAGLLGSVLTGTRGGWLALVLALLLLLRQSHLGHGHLKALLGGGVALVALLYFVPASGIQTRINEGISDVRSWNAGGNKFTNLGIRLELWKGAGMLIGEHPLFGTSVKAGHARFEQWVKEGRLADVVLTPLHMHNDALQALSTGGVPGLVGWLGILGAPFAFFARAARRGAAAGRSNAAALAGMLIPLSYFAFGLTEMMFWSGRACMFYALMVFVLMGLTLNSEEEYGN